jgi:cytochrome c biogenesis protein CcmG/thiol:disulfide interchange protein DsbE
MARFLPLLITVFLAGVFAVALLTGGAPQPPDVMLSRPAPAAPISGLDDRLLRTGTVVVNFFASWCAPCAEEQPHLLTLAKTKGFRVVGVAYKDKPAAIARWLEQHGNPFLAVGHDQDGAAALEWGVYGVPETYVLVDGVVRYRHVGVLDENTLKDAILPLAKPALPEEQ